MPRITLTGQRFVALDGFRGIAAIAVAIYHCSDRLGGGQLFPHAYLAVDFFFFLSGLVVAHAYEERLKAGKTLDYLLRRAIRLYPMAVVGALLGGLFFATYPDERGYVSLWLVAQLAVLAALSLPLLRDIFPPSHDIMPLNIPSWSLFFELFVSALYGALAKYLTTRRIVTIVILALLFECAGIYRFRGADFGVHISAFWWGVPRVMLPFFGGVLINRLATPDERHGKPNSSAVLAAVLVLTFAIPVAATGRIRALEDLFDIAVVYPVIIVLAMNTELRPWQNSIFIWLGELSFPIYLLHFPCLLWLDKIVRVRGVQPADHPYIWVFVVMVCSSALTIVVSHIYDKPLRAWLSRRHSVTKLMNAASAGGA